MTGRGVDQILPQPGEPTLREKFVRDARRYVELAEARNGLIPRPVGYGWPWGEALDVLRERAPDARIINLETSITSSAEFAPRKLVHYRMSRGNTPCLTAAAPDLCVLANNHVLDFGPRGLADTLDALASAGLRVAGAGPTASTAQEPVIVPLPDHRRIVVVSCATTSSGAPLSWAATSHSAGIDLVSDLSPCTADAIVERMDRVRRPGDVAIVSVHWGTNWGYDVPVEHRRVAHRLIDGGVDIVHGHSSHHPRPIEIYRDRLILYGCGDFIDDYEGIVGYEEYRDDLRPMFFASLDGGHVTDVRLVVMQARRMRLRHASPADAAWLRATLDRISRPFGTRVQLDADGTVTARPS